MNYKNILTRNNLLYLTSGICWGSIGFNRGVNEYDYNYINNNYYKKQYLYTDKLYNGLWGFFIYINPCFIPLIIHKELYRLEIELRGLDEEKTTSKYNRILF
jgi:hypothetical protein